MSPGETTRDLIALLRGRRVAVLTGAGCSTESGIPDYRGPETKHRTRTPILGPHFVRDADVRRRYWARAMLGWGRFAGAHPNAAHRALASLERSGAVVGIVTQNVDRLHQAAGTARIVELHGALAEVRCLECGVIEQRDSVQARLRLRNPGFHEGLASLAPDGDADVPHGVLEQFHVVTCLHCGGPLKPNVVFFGENVARAVVDAAFAIVDDAEVLLVVGTSLAVFSGYRFVLHAARSGMPCAFVNLGPSRGGELAAVWVDGKAGEVLPAVVEALSGSGLA